MLLVPPRGLQPILVRGAPRNVCGVVPNLEKMGVWGLPPQKLITVDSINLDPRFLFIIRKNKHTGKKLMNETFLLIPVPNQILLHKLKEYLFIPNSIQFWWFSYGNRMIIGIREWPQSFEGMFHLYDRYDHNRKHP